MGFYFPKSFLCGLLFGGWGIQPRIPGFLPFWYLTSPSYNIRKSKKPCDRGWGIYMHIYTQIQIYMYKNINTNTDKYRSLLFLLPLDVNLVFLDNKKWILNSMGLYSGRGAYKCVFRGFTVCYIKQNSNDNAFLYASLLNNPRNHSNIHYLPWSIICTSISKLHL